MVSEVIFLVKISIFHFLVCYSMPENNWPLFKFKCHLVHFEIEKTLSVMAEYYIKVYQQKIVSLGEILICYLVNPIVDLYWPPVTSNDLYDLE